MSKPNSGRIKKGEVRNPKGRTPILLPEIQREIDRNKNAVKQLVLQYFSLTEAQIGERQRNPEIPFIEKMLGQCFEKTAIEGDVDKFRKLLEIVFGKIPEDKTEFDLTAEEKMMVLTYRKRLLDEQRAIGNSPTNDSGTTEQEESKQEQG